jgi:dTDP-glucose 4,6-dehydratase
MPTNKTNKTILITGGAGFIGSHAVKHFVKNYPDDKVINLDKLTYAGNLENLTDVEDYSNYEFVKGDINDVELIQALFDKHNIDYVVHLAAESHVDRSIHDPEAFLNTNIQGTVNLLNFCKQYWQGQEAEKRFIHVSTDEVYGSLGDTGYFTEQTPYDPRSPYSASKAASDHLVKAYYHTYQLPVIITNCSNNYGPNQFPEKLIPLMINNLINEKSLPVYGKGENVRDWLYVEDHVKAIDEVLAKGVIGETYNIGGNNEWQNIDLVYTLCDLADDQLNRPKGKSRELVTFVKDRAGHDLRYAIDSSKIQQAVGWQPEVTFKEGLAKTFEWYLNNPEWLQNVTSGAYQEYYRKMYAV